jgi:hypothetical protein
MPSANLVRAFVVQWWTTGALLFLWSIQTLFKSVESSASHNPHIAILAAIEGVAALLFVLPRTLRIGATGLLLTFAVAFIVHLLLGQFRGDLIFYGVVVCFTAVHGPVPMTWLHSTD